MCYTHDVKTFPLLHIHCHLHYKQMQFFNYFLIIITLSIAAPITAPCHIEVEQTQNTKAKYLYASCVSNDGQPYIQVFDISSPSSRKFYPSF